MLVWLLWQTVCAVNLLCTAGKQKCCNSSCRYAFPCGCLIKIKAENTFLSVNIRKILIYESAQIVNSFLSMTAAHESNPAGDVPDSVWLTSLILDNIKLMM